jgi:hypothetical protein
MWWQGSYNWHDDNKEELQKLKNKLIVCSIVDGALAALFGVGIVITSECPPASVACASGAGACSTMVIVNAGNIDKLNDMIDDERDKMQQIYNEALYSCDCKLDTGD